ncbi:MAG TPA: metallophosphoesterase, partial [Myxococcota bacterium]|nr:metallophosphoesterase [Myxococcota bacterium]
SQRDWLAADLAAVIQDPNIKWIFVYMHEPLYSIGSHGSNKDELAAWGPVFDQYGVDFVISSHNHMYDRSYPVKANKIDTNGTYYITNGCGGAPFSNHVAGSPDMPFTAVWCEQETLVTCFTINGNSLTMETISNTTNIVKDSLTITKEPDYDPADFNHDGWVDAEDLAELTQDWLEDGMWP